MAPTMTDEARLYGGQIDAGYPERRTFKMSMYVSKAARVVSFRTHGDRVCVLSLDEAQDLHDRLGAYLKDMR